MQIPNQVLIAEKPLQANSYGEAFKVINRSRYYIELAKCSTFPQGAIIIWCIGHLLGLKEPHEYKGQEHLKKWEYNTLPIFFTNPELKVIEKVKEHYEEVKKILRDCILNNPNDNTLWIATDPDNEGSAIGWNLVNSVFSKAELETITFKRLFVKSMDKDVIFKGFQNPFPIEKDKLLAKQAQTRAIADFVVGANGSRAYSILINNSLYLQKQAEEKDQISGDDKKQVFHKSNEVWKVGRVQSATCYLVYDRQIQIENFIPKNYYELHANFQVSNGIYSGKADVKEENVEHINQLLLNHNIHPGESINGYIKEIEKEQKRESSPKLHSLTTIQTKANKLWKLSPKATLTIVQSLYERHKLLTYPRTDCQFITEAEFDYLLANVENYKSVLGVNFENKYTEPRERYVRTSAVQEHYALIPTKRIPTSEVLKSLNDNERNIYLEVLKTTVAMFHQDYIYERTTVTTELNGIDFKSVGKVELDKGFKELWELSVKSNSNDTKEKEEEENIKIPLLNKNERSSGTPEIKAVATRAPAAFTQGDLLTAMQNCGNNVDDDEDAKILKDVEGIGTVATRSDIIENLKSTRYIEVIKNNVRITEKGRVLCKSLEGTLLASPVMTAKWETYLRKIGEGTAEPQRFLQSIEKFISKLIKDAPVRVASKEVQEQIKHFIQDEKERTHFGTCPKCTKGEIVFKKSFFGCTEYKNGCEFKIWPEISKKKLTISQIKTLINKRKTGVLKGFVSKKGEPYNARLVLNDECRVIIEPTFKNNK